MAHGGQSPRKQLNYSGQGLIATGRQEAVQLLQVGVLRNGSTRLTIVSAFGTPGLASRLSAIAR